MELYWTQEAIEDREAIFDYIETDKPSAAWDLDEQFEGAAALLSTQPDLGRTGRIAGTREWVVHPNYHLLIYEQVGDRLYILNVVHAARRWP